MWLPGIPRGQKRYWSSWGVKRLHGWSRLAYPIWTKSDRAEGEARINKKVKDRRQIKKKWRSTITRGHLASLAI
jgi:hypothetical protein